MWGHLHITHCLSQLCLNPRTLLVWVVRRLIYHYKQWWCSDGRSSAVTSFWVHFFFIPGYCETGGSHIRDSFVHMRYSGSVVVWCCCSKEESSLDFLFTSLILCSECFICVMWDQIAGFGFCHSVRMSCNDIGKLQLIWIHDMVQAGIRVKIKGCTAKHCSRTTSIAWTVLVKQDTWWSPLKAFCYMEKSLSYSGPVRGFLK